MDKKMRHIKVMLDKLLEQMKKPLNMTVDVEYVKTNGYKADNSFPEDGWQKVSDGQSFCGYDQHYWLRSSFKMPERTSSDTYLVMNVTTGREGHWDATNPQGLLYLNGKMEQGFDTNHREAFLDYDTYYEMYLYFYVGMISDSVRCDFNFFEIDSRIERLYYDILVPYRSCDVMSEYDDNKQAILDVLERCVNMLDMRIEYSEEYFDSISAATAFVNDEFYGKMCGRENKPVVNCIGHTHIDLEWRWTRYQTREKIQRSFSTAASLMKRYPEFKFMLSQPVLYKYLKEEAPEKYEELKVLVKSGRWEPEGAMYVESDCNLVSGESLVRQILHGKKFFKEEFGVDCKILFLPDVFGYSAALPQILNKCGIRHFVTSKISWNDTNVMPVDTFIWEGIDGSEIFTNFITTQEHSVPPKNYTTYVGFLNPSQIKGSWTRYSQKNYSNRVLTTFGYGDGGGGPTKEMLETYRRLNKGIPGMPVTDMELLLPHLDRVRKEFDENTVKLKRTPKWVGELYLEFHRGTYTSMAKNKRNNRKCEFLLQKAEASSYINILHGGSYDAASLEEKWQLLLHDQFHDIIPGSSIKEVYDITDNDYKDISEYCNGLIASNLKAVADNLNTRSGVMVYNSLGFDVSGPIKLDGRTVEIKENIPAFGWSVVHELYDDNCLNIDGLTVENNYYILTLDESGAIERLYDKRALREVFSSDMRGNELQVFEDLPPEFDNWEISDYHKYKMWVIDNAEITPFIDGSSGGFIVKKKYLNSHIEQRIRLYSKDPRIDFETEIDWHEKHQILKAAFPFDLHVSNAVYEIQYGHVSRPTHENTSWDKAKFEVYGHKWVDMSENGYGVALLNDCKYGHNAEGSTLKLTLLKCGTFPNQEADQGKHEFTYSLLPHVGDMYTADVIKEAYLLNQPLSGIVVGERSGKLSESFSLVSTDKDNIIIEVAKKAENGSDMIVRMYDAFDRRTTAKVTVPHGFTRAYLCDLLENNIEELEFDGVSVCVPVSNFEIVTLRFVKS